MKWKTFKLKCKSETLKFMKWKGERTCGKEQWQSVTRQRIIEVEKIQIEVQVGNIEIKVQVEASQVCGDEQW